MKVFNKILFLIICSLVFLNLDLIAQGIDSLSQEFFRASARGNVKEVKRLIKSKVDVNVKNRWGKTALMFACDHDKKRMVNFLLEHGANVNEKDCLGLTALMFLKDSAILRKLLDYNPDLTIEDSEGRTALTHYINNCEIHNNFVKIHLIYGIKLLISKGVPIKSNDIDLMKLKQVKHNSLIYLRTYLNLKKIA